MAKKQTEGARAEFFQRLRQSPGLRNFIPLQIDPWIASSLLQKAIRRGDAALAEKAGATLYRLRGSSIWRRLMVIAFEDIGIADLDLVVDVARICSEADLRRKLIDPLTLAGRISSEMAAATKDRSSDYLMCSAASHPDWESCRETVGRLSPDQRIMTATDQSLPLELRSVAAWFASGMESGKETRLGSGDLSALMAAFVQAGVSQELAAATRIAAIRTKEPITVMIPVLAMEAGLENAAFDRTLVDDLPAAHLMDGIPCYAADKHTRIGRKAIAAFARENVAVRNRLAEWVPDFRARDAAMMAAYYVDAAPIARRFAWSRSHELETVGRESDMRRVGVQVSGIQPIINVVRENLADLDDHRERQFHAAVEREGRS